MGAEVFQQTASGKTPKEAFQKAVDEALYDYGHAGYTGTIAEKCSFVVIKPRAKTLEEAQERADKLIEDSDPRIDDKWGDAGCIQYDDNSYLFFGWASS
jgi:hypothetical protein